jgi:prepilin-type N-terminal cleavage/methylation domain-containing protein
MLRQLRTNRDERRELQPKRLWCPTMEMSLCSKRKKESGFSLLEVVIAIAVLAIGLSAMAALIAQSLAGTERARFMALATTLASEKLEDLNRYPNVTPAVAQLTAGGSLASDVTSYNDNVDLSNTQGQIAESVPTSTGYSNIVHQSTGEVDVTTNATTPASTGTGTVTFHRRWLIEASPAVGSITLTGSRRITVLVTKGGTNGGPPITFQMSTVRP